MSLDPDARIVSAQALSTAAQALEIAQSNALALATLAGPVPISNDHTATSGQVLNANTSLGSFILTLPTTGGPVTVGDFADTWGTNSLTVNGNGALIAGQAEFVLDAPGFLVTFTLVGGAWTYMIQFLYGAS